MRTIDQFNQLKISKADVTLIHRGRNKFISDYFKKYCDHDYNYDFRHKQNRKISNLIFNFLKSLIFLYELKKSKYYLLEGGLFIHIAILLTSFSNKRKIIFNIADPFLYKKNRKFLTKLKYKFKINFLKKCTYIFTNSPLVYDELVSIGLEEKIYYYKLAIGSKKINTININHDSNNKNILYLVTRPRETGHIKGLDVAINILKADRNKGYKYIFAGSNDIQHNSSNLIKKGFVDDISELYKECKILICPSAYDSYPGVSIECIKYSVLPLVSDRCGSAVDLKKINHNLVANYGDIQDWLSKIHNLMNLSNEKLQELEPKLTDLYNSFCQYE